jgi:hypothetical protein
MHGNITKVLLISKKYRTQNTIIRAYLYRERMLLEWKQSGIELVVLFSFLYQYKDSVHLTRYNAHYILDSSFTVAIAVRQTLHRKVGRLWVI